MYAKLCSVLKYLKSFLSYCGKRSTAREIASFAAFCVKEKYPILFGSIPLSKASSTILKRVCVLPVPGGPNIFLVVKTVLLSSYLVSQYL